MLDESLNHRIISCISTLFLLKKDLRAEILKRERLLNSIFIHVENKKKICLTML